MITLTAKIKLLMGDNKQLEVSSDNLSRNNISCEIDEILGVKRAGANPFIIGASKIGDGSTLRNTRLNYFINKSLSSAEKSELYADTPHYYFGKTFSFTLKKSTPLLKGLVIEFDKVNNKFPARMSVNGETVIDDDPVWEIEIPQTEDGTTTIEIDYWNAPKSPLVITGIYVNLEIDIDYRTLSSLSRSITDRSEISLPSYGIISNKGEMEFIDYSGEFLREYVSKQLLRQGAGVDIYLNNTLTSAQEKIGEFEVEDVNYDNDNRTVRFSLKDGLEEWQHIDIYGEEYVAQRNPLSYAQGETKSKTLAEYYEILWDKTSNRGNALVGYGHGEYNMLRLTELDDKTQDWLRHITIKYGILDSGSLWAQWTKFCEIGLCHIYKNNKGEIVCKYNGGN